MNPARHPSSQAARCGDGQNPRRRFLHRRRNDGQRSDGAPRFSVGASGADKHPRRFCGAPDAHKHPRRGASMPTSTRAVVSLAAPRQECQRYPRPSHAARLGSIRARGRAGISFCKRQSAASRGREAQSRRGLSATRVCGRHSAARTKAAGAKPRHFCAGGWWGVCEGGAVQKRTSAVPGLTLLHRCLIISVVGGGPAEAPQLVMRAIDFRATLLRMSAPMAANTKEAV